MVDAIELADLATVLRPGPHELVALVGGGGKTTLLFALGDQLGGSVVLTTTTKMGRDRTGGHPVLFSPGDEELVASLQRSRVVVAWGADGGHKAVGVDPTVCDRWFGLADHVIVEADGSRRRPFKAPRPFEPVIPSRTTMVVACVGADAIGRVIADRCQRPLRVAAAAGCSPYERLTPPRLAAVLESPRGSRKAVPPDARFVVAVNRVGPRERDAVQELAGHLTPRTELIAVAAHEEGRS